MKTSLKKLRGALSHERREHRDRIHKFRISSFDELDQAAQDMKDMRDCYDRLLSAAAATANSVYEFSESLGEMGDCLLEKTALSDDEESGKVLLMLGKLQLQLQKLFDGYRSHISQTITVPSESLLIELRIVEEMKRRCDEKRGVYDDLLKKAREKGKLRGNKGECFSSHQLQIARDEYDEEANAFVFRMKSLRQGQSRSLLTQAARHHAAQLAFLKKAVKSLEAVDPHVKYVASEQHIDYQFSGLEDDVGEDVEDDDEYDDSDDSSDSDGGSELSFDYGQNDMTKDHLPASRTSMELDYADVKLSQVAKVDAPKKNLERFSSANLLPSQHEANKASSKSGPLLLDRRFDQAERRLEQLRQSPSQKFNSYVLPTPQEMKGSFSGKSDTNLNQPRRSSLNATPNLWHSSPLLPNKYEKVASHFSGPIAQSTQSILKESNDNTRSGRSPPAFTDGLSPRQQDPHFVSDNKKPKRQAFSGPLAGKPWSNKSFVSASGPISQTGGYHQPFSGPLLRNPMSRPGSTMKFSSRTSPTFVSPPKISELHELPRPPPHLARSANPVHSGPLVSKSQDHFTTSQDHFTTSRTVVSSTVSALPLPPKIIPRSYSIPSIGQIEATLHVALEAPDNPKMAEDLTSPLSPLSIPSSQTTPSVS